jgi:uncharacterized membrane protein
VIVAETERGARDARMVERMLFFSDAVFAIALTLLVLELGVPEGVTGGEGALWEAVRERIPHFIAVAISFALAGGWWLIHQAATQALVRFDWPTACLNLVLLMFIMLLPFAAGMLGEYADSGAALGIYWIVNAGAAFSLTLMTFVMSRGRGRLLREGIRPRERFYRLGQAFVPGVCFVFGTAFAFSGELAWSRFCWLPIPLYMALGGLFLARRRTAAPSAAA